MLYRSKHAKWALVLAGSAVLVGGAYLLASEALALLAVLLPWAVWQWRSSRRLAHQLAAAEARVEQLEQRLRGELRRDVDGLRGELQRARETAAELRRRAQRNENNIAGTSRSLDSVKGQLREAGERLGGVVFKLRQEVQQEIAERKRGDAQARQNAAQLSARLDDVHSGLATQVERLGKELRHELREAVKQEKAVRVKEIAAEKGERLAFVARARSSGTLPQRCALIVSPQRTGSTWLFDALRCHPGIHVEPTAAITEALGMGGVYRYPAGLSNEPGATLAIELKTNYGALIPAFSPAPEIRALAEAAGLMPFAVEKIHPQFYDWNTTAFLARLRDLSASRGMGWKLLLRMRAPRSTMLSMLRYKRRDPNWYHAVPEEEVPSFICRSFQSLHELREQTDCEIVDYSSDRAVVIESLIGAFMHLWPHGDRSVQRQIATWCESATRRESRGHGKETKFLGAQTSEQERTDAELEALLKRHEAVLAECERIYHSLLRLDRRPDTLCA